MLRELNEGLETGERMKLRRLSNSQKEKTRFQIIWPNLLLFLPDNKIAFFLLPIPRDFASSFLLESQIVYLKNFLSADVHFLANNQLVSQS